MDKGDAQMTPMGGNKNGQETWRRPWCDQENKGNQEEITFYHPSDP